MTKFTQRLLMTASAVLLVGASTVAMARGGQDCGGMGAGGGIAGNGPRAENMQARMGGQFAQRQADLKAKLKLTAEQDSAWAAFTTAMTPPGMPRMNPAEMQSLTTPQRIEKMQAMKAERDSQMSKRMEAAKAFYAALTPEQQKVFDAQPMRGMHGGQGGHGGHQRGGQRQG